MSQKKAPLDVIMQAIDTFYSGAFFNSGSMNSEKAIIQIEISAGRHHGDNEYDFTTRYKLNKLNITKDIGVSLIGKKRITDHATIQNCETRTHLDSRIRELNSSIDNRIYTAEPGKYVEDIIVSTKVDEATIKKTIAQYFRDAENSWKGMLWYQDFRTLTGATHLDMHDFTGFNANQLNQTTFSPHQVYDLIKWKKKNRSRQEPREYFIIPIYKRALDTLGKTRPSMATAKQLKLPF